MLSPLARAIRAARHAAGLTQEQLGRRLGLKGRAVYRWEGDDAAPSKRNRAALVTAIAAVNQAAAAELAAAIAALAKPVTRAAVAIAAPTAQPAPTVIAAPVALELAILAMADELDLTPRRVRGSLIRLARRLREVDLSIDATQQLLEQHLASVNASG